LGEQGAWVNPGTPQIFEVPPIISEMGKATNVKFGRYIQMVHANKIQLKIWEKMERGLTPQIFWVSAIARPLSHSYGAIARNYPYP